MDFYPSALVQPEINRPADDVVDNEEDSSSKSVPDEESGSLNESEPPEICRLATPKASLSISSSSPSFSSTGEYRHQPWEISLAQFKPVNNSISYERDSPEQKLVAVIGRDFDTPIDTSELLQKQYKAYGETLDVFPKVKFLGYEVRRKELLSNQFRMEDIQNHDLIAMCYNASEARILLTGEDGFYTSLLKQVERMLGPNKAVFLIYNYHPHRQSTADSTQVIDQSLHRRLLAQESLKYFLDNEQVLSWVTTPTKTHLQKLSYLTELDSNPVPYSYTDGCCVL